MMEALSWIITFLWACIATFMSVRRSILLTTCRKENVSLKICDSEKFKLLSQEWAKVSELKRELKLTEDERNQALSDRDSLAVMVYRLQCRLVKFNITVEPTEREIAKDGYLAAWDKLKAARAEYERVKSEDCE